MKSWGRWGRDESSTAVRIIGEAATSNSVSIVLSALYFRPPPQSHTTSLSNDHFRLDRSEQLPKKKNHNSYRKVTMTRQSLSKATGLVARSLRSSSLSASRLAPRRSSTVSSPNVAIAAFFPRSRFVSTTPALSKGILPDSDDPAPPDVQTSTVKAVPAELSDDEYHALADEYMDVICSRLEDIGEKNAEVDVEYSVRQLSSPRFNRLCLIN